MLKDLTIKTRLSFVNGLLLSAERGEAVQQAVQGLQRNWLRLANGAHGVC